VAVYAIGDLQGCDRELAALLKLIRFCDDDQLWLLGDLLNRGPDSLAVLRRVKALGERCQIVLGNHDLHFLAIYFGGHNGGRNDTFDELLSAPDVDELAHWLRVQKLMHRDDALGAVMAHAGIPHFWSIADAELHAREVERVIAGRDSELSYTDFFKQMYGNEPSCWNDSLEAMPRMRMITNYFTRMRLVDDSGAMDFAHKGSVDDAPPGLRPWFEFVGTDLRRPRILFGHWAALDGQTGREDIVALDTGCVWGRQLTAMNLQTGKKYAVNAIS
jgi:bis(5'-nucleosyl)-tetraphosphatase (symmetrical)